MLNFENEIKPKLIEMMINIRDKKYNKENEKQQILDLNYNLAITNVMVELSKLSKSKKVKI